MIRTLDRDARGAALIEFGLVLPLLLILGLGGIETAHYVLSIMRTNEIAQSVADNAGRVRHALDEADIDEIMIGGKLIGQGMDFATNGRIILSDLEQRTTTTGTGGVGPTSTANPNGYRQWVRWQRCAGALNRTSSYGGPISSTGTAVTDLSAAGTDHGAAQNVSTIDGMGPAGQQIAAASGTAVMVVEVFYTYQPILPIYFFGATTIHVTEAYNIRQRTDFSIYNANSRTGNQRSDCRLFNAAVPT